VTVDQAGNAYIAGQTFSGFGSHDFLTLKYDPLGNEKWNMSFDDATHNLDLPRAVLADGAGGLYVTGQMAGDFGTIRYQQPVCHADVVPDAAVNINDLVAVITAWGPCPAGQPGCAGDISPAGFGDGAVDIDDLVSVITAWGACP
jgi:hypothetical protein